MFSSNFNITEILKNIFGKKTGNLDITLFSLWHILYIVCIIGLIIGGSFILKNKSEKTKKITLNVVSILTLSIYIFDIMVQPFVTSDFTIDIDKLPFHICTLMGILIVFAQFSNKNWFKEIAVAFAIVGSLIYLIYPGSALGGISPFCYKVIQTFLFHGLLLAWGILSLTSGQVEFNFKHWWYTLVGGCVLVTWATLGNISFNGGPSHYDWLFITGSTFDFLPKDIMPLIGLVAIWGASMVFYFVYWLCTFRKRKNNN